MKSAMRNPKFDSVGHKEAQECTKTLCDFLCIFVAKKVRFRIWAVLAFSFGCLPASAGPSPFAKVEEIPLGEVRWTSGFWAERFALCRDTMVPAMGQLMTGTNYTQFVRNFEIAAGLAQGRPRGAQFNDGDFYKWLEAA